MVRSKLLVVDDERNKGLLYEQELEDEGYDVDIATSGVEALEKFKMNSYDLVVLDIGMPEMDGLETLGRLVAIDNSIPVIIYTAFPSFKENFMSWAADAYVVKSMDLGELKDKIKEVLGK
ncbi:response regulator [Candidatus Latescibacterota bacterium]